MILRQLVHRPAAIPGRPRGGFVRTSTRVLALALSPGILLSAAVHYSTAFEPPEFEVGASVEGHDGWVADAAGGSQVVTNFFEAEGQQALVGFSEPEGTNASVSVWRPINITPVAVGEPLVTFTVSFAIFDSTTTNRDDFRWSVWNRESERLFSLDLDNQTTEISYLLDDEQFVSTGFTFENGGIYDLAVTMNFASNVWSASLNEQLIVNALPMTTRGATLDLGDVDAVWVLGYGSPRFGDNYMAFDNYQVASHPPAPLPSEVELVDLLPSGAMLLRLIGEPGRSYAIDATSDLQQWTPIKTNNPTDGTFEFLDEQAIGIPVRFYRGRAIVP